MEVFIPSVNAQVTTNTLREKIREILAQPECWSGLDFNSPIGYPPSISTGSPSGGKIVREFGMRLWKNRQRGNQQGTILIHDITVALKLINYVATRPLFILNQPVRFVPGRNQPSNFEIEMLTAENARAEEQAAQAARAAQRGGRRKKTVHDFRDLQCGAWKSTAGAAEHTFYGYYQNAELEGEIRFYSEGVVLTIHDQAKTEMLFVKSSIRSIITAFSRGGSHVVTFTLSYPPKIHKVNTRLGASPHDYYRTSAIDPAHAEVAPYCFVYRLVSTAGSQGIKMIEESARRWKLPQVTRIPTLTQIIPQGPTVMMKDIEQLQYLITRYKFCVAFQLEALYINGCMLPSTVRQILPEVDRVVASLGARGAASVLKAMVEHSSGQDPMDDVEDWTLESLTAWLREKAENKKWTIDAEERARIKYNQKSNLVEIHRVSITPAGRWLSGPTLEPKNRVLRLWETHLDHFLRVDFTEEDNSDLFLNDSAVKTDHLFETRLKQLFDPFPKLMKFADKRFSFLGFSQSSLRNHQCWFMASIWEGRQWLSVDQLIAEMGEFKDIRIPGKCAARIGQAFSDTIDCMYVHPHEEKRIGDVVSSGPDRRIFSDGCGTISLELLREVWAKRNYDENQCPPTSYQIRFSGAKGVVSLDTRLRGRQLCLRPTMIKFFAPKHRQFEACSDNKEPLPMYLNRPLVKVLEDLGVPDKSFLDLQDKAVQYLQQVQLSSKNAMHFLYLQNVGNVFGLPALFYTLETEIRASFHEVTFLKSVLHYALLIQLRDMKYRTRIKVDGAVTVIGIMDETGYLKEGEVYVVTETEKMRRRVLTGSVVVTKSPVHHPGDVRIVTAVEVPMHSSLRNLRNCICFSQYGARDLPSMLSGGDLDGDLYNVIYDPTMLPTRQVPPADYPRVEAKDIGRPVTQQDIGEFFIKFMLNDRLGTISTNQQIIADQAADGIFHRDCLKLAELASVAVDFPKTGIEVDSSQIPRPKPHKPDFMAPGPRVLVDNKDDSFHDERDEALSDVSESEDDNPGRHNPQVAARRRRQGRRKRVIYYKSHKVTGQLYRAIDESTFIKDMKQATKSYINNKLYSHRDVGTVLSRVRDWVECSITDAMINESKTEMFVGFAVDLRDTYETHVRDLMLFYGDSRTSSISEAEVFGGFILGRGELAKLTRRQREDSKNLRDEATELFRGIVDAIRKREAPVGDEKRGKNKSLQKCLACLNLAVLEEDESKRAQWQEDRRRRRGVGQWRVPLKGFGWIVAAAAMREVANRDRIEELESQFGGVRLDV